jgi:hypothetical protein
MVLFLFLLPGTGLLMAASDVEASQCAMVGWPGMRRWQVGG